MAERNPLFEAALEVGQELAAGRRAAKAAKPIPFGEEKVSAETLRKRLREDQTLRRKFLAESGGQERLLRLFRSKERR